MKKTYHVGLPNVGDRSHFLEQVNDILDKKWLTNSGEYCQAFEASICELLRVKHCIAMCNGTVALEIASRALDMDGEVIVPSFTFAATAHSLQWQGITPVFCDVDLSTHNIDTDAIEALISPRTSGILAVHLWGRPCNTDRLSQIAQKHNLKLLFDASHAFGCSHNGMKIGNFGDAEVFSFHATKFINTLEGGCITTNDRTLAEKLRLMRNFGFIGYDNVEYLGINGKMNEVSAAMGLTNLRSMAQFTEQNRSNYLRYKKRLSEIKNLALVEFDEDQTPNYQYIVADLSKTGAVRDDIVKTLHAHQILARRYFYPGCHRMKPYKGKHVTLPNTESLSDALVVLPNSASMNDSDIDYICDTFKQAIR